MNIPKPNPDSKRKGAKWIGEIVFRDHDELGYWEQRGYSNSAEPWLEDRYSK